MIDAQNENPMLRRLIERWRNDPSGTYQSWFLWEERIKNFRSIRRGLQAVTAEIEQGQFGNLYRGSSLETVVASIAEQRQIFKGADHAFFSSRIRRYASNQVIIFRGVAQLYPTAQPQMDP
jgi:hypothetical protein